MNYFENNNVKIDKEQFKLINDNERIKDTRFETKPVGYLQDAMRRFVKNSASVVAAFIILLLIIFSIVAPFITPFALSFRDPVYNSVLPKISNNSGTGFWDGATSTYGNTKTYLDKMSRGVGAEDYDAVGKNGATFKSATFEEGLASKYSAIVSDIEEGKIMNTTVFYYRLDSYHDKGFTYDTVNLQQYQDIKDYEARTGKKVLYPMLNTYHQTQDANTWYDTTLSSVTNGFVHNYLTDSNGNIVDFAREGTDSRRVRVLCYTYFEYNHGVEPVFFFGADTYGRDIFVRLAKGLQTSLMLGFTVTISMFIIGSVIGACQGYYGGWFDLIIERLMEIVGYIPGIIIFTLFNYHLVIPDKISPLQSLFLYFLMFGWMGTAGMVRRQFYRFKVQDYVLSARTLGAKDGRIMFRHIFPNSIGYIITSSILGIPGIIYLETSLSYLGILNLDSPTRSSIGSMFADAQGYFRDYPHMLLWPAIFVSLLMISFNLFGNGLRDAFNPQLRGNE